MPGTVGNTNSADGKRYRKALERALAHKHGSVDDGLFALAKARVDKALDGDGDAAKEIGDRFDGKPGQQVMVSGDPDRPLVHEVVQRTIVDPRNTNS